MPDNFNLSKILSNQLIARRVLKSIVLKRNDRLKDAATDVPLSIIIRNYNEAPQLKELLESLSAQVYAAPVQLILQDNGSTDESLALAQQYKMDIAALPQSEFSYPKGMNLGMKKAKHELAIITVAHALPAHNYWLRAVAAHFVSNKVAGVYGPLLASANSKLNERILRPPSLKLRSVYKEAARGSIGVLGATNCAVRRSLWQKHNFDESYAVGAEDVEWARWALSKGYKIIFDSLMVVHHSHGLNLIQNMGEMNRYRKMTSQPLSLDALSPHAKKRYGKI